MSDKTNQFDNPELDKMLAILLSLGNEVYVMRDRLRIIEKMMDKKGVISRADIETYELTPEEEAENRKECDAFMERLFRVFNTN